MTQKTLDYSQLGFDLADVYEQMGYHGQLPDEATQAETETIIGEVDNFFKKQKL